jgi:predicted PhzF superfamily epimerase YddE/YHI9
MPIPLFQVDAFTDEPFSGNPAAVCLLDAPRHPTWMQKVGREMNLSETAFLSPDSDRGDGYELRWFTPTCEMICGHATLASAHVLWETRRLASDSPAKFRTKSGVLTCNLRGSRIEMDSGDAAEGRAAAQACRALGVTPRNTARSRFDWLVEVGTEDEVRAATPDFGRLKRVEARGVIVARVEERLRESFRPGGGRRRGPGDGFGALLPGCTEPEAPEAGDGRLAGTPRGGEVRVKLQATG